MVENRTFCNSGTTFGESEGNQEIDNLKVSTDK